LEIEFQDGRVKTDPSRTSTAQKKSVASDKPTEQGSLF